MSKQNKQAVIVDCDKDSSSRIASLIQFLEYEPHVAPDIFSVLKLCGELDDIVVFFVRVSASTELLDNTLAVLESSGVVCPCYVIWSEDHNISLPTSTKNKISGTLVDPTSYKQILGVMHEADLLLNSHENNRGQQSIRLFRSLVGISRDTHYVRELIKQVAATEASVLILGESGTGKEVVARNIHDFSNRRDQSFVPVNCGAIPAELLESELFGHEKGAFTGAISARQGRFEIADGGTLFLDEIGDMPMNMQVKLLRVLQERTFERVGSNKTISVDVRIVAATHQNLEQLVTEGRFRMDLFYRLNVFPIQLPPLRDRTEDIPLLVKEFVHRMELNKQGSVLLDASAMAALTKYYWPGNVRELSNLIERLAILFPKKVVKWSDLPEKFRPNQDWIADESEDTDRLDQQNYSGLSLGAVPLLQGGIDLKNYLADIECSFMTQALEQTDWVVARAAKLLNLQRTTLVEKMRKFEINRPDDTTYS